MRQEDLYENTNVELYQNQRTRPARKPRSTGPGEQPGIQGPSHRKIYVCLGLSILLSSLLLLAVVVLFTLQFSKMRALESEISQMKNNSQTSICCPCGWIHFKNSCYYFSSREADWPTAQTECELLESHLVVIKSEEEQTFLWEASQRQQCWIGLNDIKVEGGWRWVDGTDYASSVQFWSGGEPNSKGDEDCGVFWNDGKWNDLSCLQNKKFICQKTF